MSKYILGQSHEGTPITTNEKTVATVDLVGSPVCMDASGLVVIADGSAVPYGVVAGKGIGGNLSVIQAGLKVLVKTTAPVTTFGDTAYITSAGLFTTSSASTQATGAKFVAPDNDFGDGETIAGNFALISFVGGL
jgi:hypothetical protein